MNALELLKTDHDKVRELFREFEAAAEKGDQDRFIDLVSQIAEELEVHTAIEEIVLYPAARNAGEEAEDLALEGIEEHHVVDQLLEEIKGMHPSDEAYIPKVKVLIENVEHHAEEEEQELFPELEETLGTQRLEELGQELEKAKHDVQAQQQSKQSLYDRARDLNIPGRSQMTKEELAEAVKEKSG
jgi:hemerythrin-like domain-containing protein